MANVTNVFAKRLKELREERGLNQTQLAAEVGISRGSISYYENCERTPDIEILQRIAEYFGIPMSYLLGESGRGIERKSLYDAGFSEKSVMLLLQNNNAGKIINEIILSPKFNVIMDLLNCVKTKLFNDVYEMNYISQAIANELTEIMFDVIDDLHPFKDVYRLPDSSSFEECVNYQLKKDDITLEEYLNILQERRLTLERKLTETISYAMHLEKNA